MNWTLDLLFYNAFCENFNECFKDFGSVGGVHILDLASRENEQLSYV